MKKFWVKFCAIIAGIGALLAGLAYLITRFTPAPHKPELDVEAEKKKIDDQLAKDKATIESEANTKKDVINNSTASQIIDMLDDGTKKDIADIASNTVNDIMEEIKKRGQ